MSRLTELLGEIGSIIVALLRLAFLTCAMVTSGIHIVLFTRTEVWNVEMKGMPWRCDREKMNDQLAFVDKICLENPELLDYADEHTELPPDIDEGGNDI